VRVYVEKKRIKELGYVYNNGRGLAHSIQMVISEQSLTSKEKCDDKINKG
jgi:hypothetical protein